MFAALPTEPGSNVYEGDIYTVTAGPPLGTPFDPTAVVPLRVGTAKLTFRDGSDATFDYTVYDKPGSKRITRQIFNAPGTLCQ